MFDLALLSDFLDPELAPLQGADLGYLALLTSVEDERHIFPLQYGPVEGLAVLRRRRHGTQTGMLEVVELPACGLVVASSDGTANWGAHGLEHLDDRRLEIFRRKTLELVGAVTREQVRREVLHAE